jgi:cysteine synthase A
LFVGNTPTIKLFVKLMDKKVEVLAKYEAWNFTGSIKDRMALEILRSAYR